MDGLHSVMTVFPGQAMESLCSEMQRRFGGDGRGRVQMGWSVEWNRSCQQVLKETFANCCCPDIFLFDTTAATSDCTTHGKQCPVQRSLLQCVCKCSTGGAGCVPVCIVRLISGSSGPRSNEIKVAVAGLDLESQPRVTWVSITI